MDFVKFHQAGNPVLINLDTVKLVYKAIKGRGSLIITDIDGHDVLVDESPIEVIERLTEMDVEIIEFAND